MRLDDGDRSNVEDRRGSFAGRPGLKLGLGGTVLLVALSLVFKQDLFALLGAAPGGPGGGSAASPAQVQQRQAAEVGLEKTAVASFNDAQGVWSKAVKDYRPAKLVLFWDETRSGCGEAAASMGPFYCPADERVYIDLGFYRELATRFGAPGQFGQAYVIAHEMGHHLQNVLGIERQLRMLQEKEPGRRNAISVRVELQADCFAGAWARTARQRDLLDAGDLEQGLAAAAAVGDDRLQKAATGRVTPDSFTHGSSEQRVRWFRVGFDKGELEACNTYRAKEP